jgi:ribonuclease BN (tRNA processing enzyme)
MRLIAGGVRGTSVVADTAFAQFGGHTTAFLVQSRTGETVLIDAGSGLRTFEPLLQQGSRRALLMLMTHYHLDHLIGLPTMPALYHRAWSLEFAAPVLEGTDVQSVLQRIIGEPFWPVQMRDVPAAVRFMTLPEGQPFAGHGLGAIECRWCRLNHPGACAAYRFDEAGSGASLVVATDVEWDTASPEQQDALVHLCAEPCPAGALIFDGHYTPARYERHRGWGHSRWTDGVTVAQRAGVRQLLITHHAPDADDSALAAVEAELKRHMPGAALLRQSQTVELPAV